MTDTTSAPHQAAIGVFDSGIGGLSVLQHIREALPAERLLYFADAGFAPYGDKSEAFIIERSLAIAEFFVAQHIKALVVACNTATARAIAVLRERYPQLIIVGIEPGLKPAALHSKSKIVGVMATQGTLQSAKFQTLRDQLSQEAGVTFVTQACIGLADQIEKAEPASAETVALVQRYVTPLLEHDVDTIVLGCTHYPFVADVIQQIIVQTRGAGAEVKLINTGEAVTRQLQRLLEKNALLQISADERSKQVHAWTTGSASSLHLAFQRILKMPESAITVTALQA